MKEGTTLEALASELQRQYQSKEDYVADTRKARITSNGESHLAIDLQDGTREYTVTPLCHRQISERAGIPWGYYERLQKEMPHLLDTNVNTLWQEKPEKRMVRTLDGRARAFLSDRYRPLDNYDLANVALETLLTRPDTRVESCELTDNRLFIKAVFDDVEAKLDNPRQVNDIVKAGIVISNSEVGMGSLKVQPLVFRLVCLNGMILEDYGQRKFHVGKAHEVAEGAAMFYRAETREADDKAFWLKTRDTIKGVADQTQFGSMVDAFNQTMQLKIDADPVAVVQRTQEKFGLQEAERGGVLRHLIEGGDLSAFGLINAITRTSQDVQDYERATELETIGGAAMVLPKADWMKLVSDN